MDDKQQIREFVGRHIRNHQLADTDDLFATGFVNSMFAMQLVQFVESQFGVTVESDDMDIDNFRSIEAIAGLVARKTAAPVS